MNGETEVSFPNDWCELIQKNGLTSAEVDLILGHSEFFGSSIFNLYWLP